jgi:hypothetical protein
LREQTAPLPAKLPPDGEKEKHYEGRSEQQFNEGGETAQNGLGLIVAKIAVQSGNPHRGGKALNKEACCAAPRPVGVSFQVLAEVAVTNLDGGRGR